MLKMESWKIGKSSFFIFKTELQTMVPEPDPSVLEFTTKTRVHNHNQNQSSQPQSKLNQNHDKITFFALKGSDNKKIRILTFKIEKY